MNIIYSLTDLEVGETIRKYRLLAKLSQKALIAKLAEIDGAIGLNQPRLSKIERGLSEVKWRELRAIAIVTGTQIETFTEAG